MSLLIKKIYIKNKKLEFGEMVVTPKVVGATFGVARRPPQIKGLAASHPKWG
jgi:hypothetical protein